MGLFGLPPEYRALHPRLEQALNRPVRFVAQPNGKALGIQLEQKRMDYAILTAAEYADFEKPEILTPLATAKNVQGRTSRKALLLANAASSVRTLADCKGKRFAFGTFRDALTDHAVRVALARGGVPVRNLLPELLPPPLGMEGRLYTRADAPKTVAFDLTVPAGTMDEIAFAALPERGGNLLTGPSKDQFIILGETEPVPELLVAAGPKADPAVTKALTEFLLQRVEQDRDICEQWGIAGFAPADRAAYDRAKKMLGAE